MASFCYEKELQLERGRLLSSGNSNTSLLIASGDFLSWCYGLPVGVHRVTVGTATVSIPGGSYACGIVYRPTQGVIVVMITTLNFANRTFTAVYNSGAWQAWRRNTDAVV